MERKQNFRRRQESFSGVEFVVYLRRRYSFVWLLPLMIPSTAVPATDLLSRLHSRKGCTFHRRSASVYSKRGVNIVTREQHCLQEHVPTSVLPIAVHEWAINDTYVRALLAGASGLNAATTMRMPPTLQSSWSPRYHLEKLHLCLLIPVLHGVIFRRLM